MLLIRKYTNYVLVSLVKEDQKRELIVTWSTLFESGLYYWLVSLRQRYVFSQRVRRCLRFRSAPRALYNALSRVHRDDEMFLSDAFLVHFSADALYGSQTRPTTQLDASCTSVYLTALQHEIQRLSEPGPVELPDLHGGLHGDGRHHPAPMR